jgi:hypothetical protein
MKIWDKLTKEERKQVEKQNRELLKEAHKRGVFPTDEEKAKMLQSLLLKAIAKKEQIHPS